VRKDRRQETLALAVTDLRPDPWHPWCIRDSQLIQKILLNAMQSLLAINENVTVLGGLAPTSTGKS
jgi:hypothetical protein